MAYRWWKDWGTWLLATPVALLLLVPANSPAAFASYLLASASACLLTWRAASASGDRQESGFSWRAGAIGYGVLLVGDLLFTLGLRAGWESLLAAAGLLFFLVFPLFVWALLRGIRRLTRPVGLRLGVDFLAAAVTGALLIGFLDRVAEGRPLSVLVVAAGYPIGNLLMIIISGLVLFEVHADSSSRPLLGIATANLLFLLGNLGFSAEILRNGGFSGLITSGPLYGMASFGARLMVAASGWYMYRLHAQGRQAPLGRGLAVVMGNLVPHSAILVTFLFVLAGGEKAGIGRVALLYGGLFLILLLFIRQLLVLRENATLASEAVQLANDLRRSESRFRTVVQNSADIVCIADRRGRVFYISPAVTTVLGYDESDILGRTVDAFIHQDDVWLARETLPALLDRAGEIPRISLRLRHRDGSYRVMAVAANNMADDPAVKGIVFNLHDMTERVALEEQLKYQAFHDPLTGLPNRALLRERIGVGLARAARHDEEMAVFLLDLDGFKLINDTWGHEAGDRLLVEASMRLMTEFRPGDTVARLGGDEFAVLVEEVSAEEAAGLAERILDALRKPFCGGGKDVVVGVSIGIAMRSTQGRSTDELLRNADLAMYRAKAAGKDCYRFFEPSMYSAVVDRMDLEADMRRALMDGEFEVYYQPTVALQTGEIHGVEALLRWRHPRQGMVQPVHFIPLAEETGLIVPLGRWVLEQACQQAKLWQERYPSRQPLNLSVNLSVRQLADPRLVDEVEQVLRDTGLPPSTLLLEITESIFLESTDATIAAMRQLRALGVRIAVDDFGTGYSSLGYLKRFPLDLLKIDKSFVHTLGVDGRDNDLVRGILELAQILGMETLAEGVEREEQRAILWQLGCRFGQGYLFSRPRTAEEIEALLLPQGAIIAP